MAGGVGVSTDEHAGFEHHHDSPQAWQHGGRPPSLQQQLDELNAKLDRVLAFTDQLQSALMNSPLAKMAGLKG